MRNPVSTWREMCRADRQIAETAREQIARDQELGIDHDADIDREPPASAAGWLEVAPGDRHPYGLEAQA